MCIALIDSSRPLIPSLILRIPPYVNTPCQIATMPGIVQRGRKRPSHAVSEESDSESPASTPTSSAGKRARHNQNAPNGLDRITAHSQNEFKAGSLVRVKLTNFVTYTAAEFHLGPSLNMVIGPNGTGKSTLVCAICLGLGWNSEHLGRAKELGQFVKHGATEAIIEIELATGPGKGPNRRVKRLIRKEDNKSIFFLEDKRVTQKDVTTMAKEYSIQIDNLCQFLPQDRVVEFSRMTDVERLRETLRAAAPPYMVEWHDQLKALRAEERSVETKQNNERGHLEKLEKQQTSTRDDVDRHHQREGLMRKSKCLEKVRPMIEMKGLKADINEIKQEIREAKLELDQINVDIEPARQAQLAVEAYQNQIKTVVNLRKNRVDMIRTQADNIAKKVDAEKTKAAESTVQIKAELASKKTSEQDIARLTRDIQKLEQQRSSEPDHYDAESYEQRNADLRTEISSRENLIVDKKRAMNDIGNRVHDNKRQHDRLKAQGDRLNTQSGKQASLLQRLSSDTAVAWDWIQKHKSSLGLKGQVCGPPILECSIKDTRYAQAIEGQMRKGDVLAITCTNKDDQNLLMDRLLTKANGLGLQDVYLRTSPRPLSAYQRPVNGADLNRYGFEGYVLDYITGPKEVLAMLCDNTRLHQVAYAATPISDEQHEAVLNSSIRSWVSGANTYRVVSRYNQSSTSVTKLKQAQFFVDQPANVAEIREIQEKIKQLGRDNEELIEQNDILRNEAKNLGEEIKAFREERVQAPCGI
jgi:chromosome segregation ATPase